jgi:hypothetical protein
MQDMLPLNGRTCVCYLFFKQKILSLLPFPKKSATNDFSRYPLCRSILPTIHLHLVTTYCRKFFFILNASSEMFQLLKIWKQQNLSGPHTTSAEAMTLTHTSARGGQRAPWRKYPARTTEALI